jgi:hypothetical protein
LGLANSVDKKKMKLFDSQRSFFFVHRKITRRKQPMKKIIAFLTTMLFAATAYAFQPTLKNEDSKAYKYEIKCTSSSTHSSVSANTSQTLSGVGCMLIIPGAGSAKLADNMKCVIKNGALTCH